MIKNILKGWRTSVLGVIVIGTCIMYIYLKEPVDYIVMSILLGVGILLLFAPDKLIKKLEKLTESEETK